MYKRVAIFTDCLRGIADGIRNPFSESDTANESLGCSRHPQPGVPSSQMTIEQAFELAEGPNDVGDLQVACCLADIRKAHGAAPLTIRQLMPCSLQVGDRQLHGFEFGTDGNQFPDVSVAHSAPTNPSASSTNVAGLHG